MKVNPQTNTGAMTTAPVPAVKGSSSRPAATDTVTIRDAETVNRALEQTPPARPEAVERAKELTQNVAYPPLETIEAIANLLAIKIEPDQE